MEKRERIQQDEAFTGAAGNEPECLRNLRAVRMYKRLIAMFSVFLVFGELVNWDASPGIRIFGAAFDLCLITVFYREMRWKQAKLKKAGETSR